MKNFKSVLLVMIVISMMAFGGCNQISEPPPYGSVELFNGSDFVHWTKEDGSFAEWRIIGDAMEVVPGKGSIMTKYKFRDFKLHVEFNIPEIAEDVTGQGRGNSGVYLQRRYEVQILDSYGIKSGISDCGALYKAKAPDKNVCKKPLKWQSYDITFRAARFEGGKKIENVRINVIHNGVLIHDNVELTNKTGAGRPEGPEAAPILLQDHGNKVKFRNIWIVPLD